jgi:hypothetical protein
MLHREIVTRIPSPSPEWHVDPRLYAQRAIVVMLTVAARHETVHKKKVAESVQRDYSIASPPARDANGFSANRDLKSSSTRRARNDVGIETLDRGRTTTGELVLVCVTRHMYCPGNLITERSS